jgi:hypothetical protein
MFGWTRSANAVGGASYGRGMEAFGYVALALAVGLGIGAAVAVASRRPGQPPADTARIEARLEVQSAELRRLADGATVQDGGTERVRSELAGARRALEMLALKEEERRERERESWQVVRRLSTVLAGGRLEGPGRRKPSSGNNWHSCRRRCSSPICA